MHACQRVCLLPPQLLLLLLLTLLPANCSQTWRHGCFGWFVSISIRLDIGNGPKLHFLTTVKSANALEGGPPVCSSLQDYGKGTCLACSADAWRKMEASSLRSCSCCLCCSTRAWAAARCACSCLSSSCASNNSCLGLHWEEDHQWHVSQWQRPR